MRAALLGSGFALLLSPQLAPHSQPGATEAAPQLSVAAYVRSNSTIYCSNYLTSEDSFSAVLKPNFASKYALELGSI